jgi:hypothetical protein
MNEHHRGALTLGESFEGRSEGWLVPGFGMLGANEERAAQSFSGSTLTYSIQISGHVLHCSDLLPVLPGIGEGFCRRLAPAFCAVGSDKCPAKTRLCMLHEQAKLAVDVLGHSNPVRMPLLR